MVLLFHLVVIDGLKLTDGIFHNTFLELFN